MDHLFATKSWMKKVKNTQATRIFSKWDGNFLNLKNIEGRATTVVTAHQAIENQALPVSRPPTKSQNANNRKTRQIS